MNAFTRYGIYMVPRGDLYATGSAWLGWDSAAGRAVPQPDLPDLPVPPGSLTARPRKYGLHATLKPPFRLAGGATGSGLQDAMAAFCATRPSVTIPALTLRRIGRFLALVPAAPAEDLADLAADTVVAFEPFRAPLGAGELEKRAGSRLSERQKHLLQGFGYPYVMEQFRFHITLTGPLDSPVLDSVEKILGVHFADHIGQPLAIDDLALVGEDADGMFHLLHRYRLTG
jgi:hypothetical protein